MKSQSLVEEWKTGGSSRSLKSGKSMPSLQIAVAVQNPGSRFSNVGATSEPDSWYKLSGCIKCERRQQQEFKFSIEDAL